MDNIPDTIYFKDTASRFTHINQAQARMLGVADPEEAIGKTDVDFFRTATWLNSFWQKNSSSDQRGANDRSGGVQSHARRPTALVSASKVPLRDAAGQIVGLVGISRDITDRHLMEERLRESQARFGSAFEYAAVGMALVAPDHSILQVNQAFCRMLGYDEAEVVDSALAVSRIPTMWR